MAARIWLVGAITLGAACVLGTAAASPNRTAVKPKPKTPKPAVHRVGIRTVSGVSELYDRKTEKRLVLRGNNYHRVDPTQAGTDQVTFGVGRYDAARAEAALGAMQALGYNTVRVFMAGECPAGCIGNPSTRRLSGPYLANVRCQVWRPG